MQVHASFDSTQLAEVSRAQDRRVGAAPTDRVAPRRRHEAQSRPRRETHQRGRRQDQVPIPFPLAVAMMRYRRLLGTFEEKTNEDVDKWALPLSRCNK